MTDNVIVLTPRLPAGPECRAVIETLSTAQLKRAWDAWGKLYEPHDKGDFILEALHAELNKRGEGVYCAV